MTAIAIAVLAVQFAARRSATSRLIALVGTLALLITLVLLPWPAAFALQSSLTETWDGQLGAELVRNEPAPRADFQYLGGVQLHFDITGVPADRAVLCEGREIAIEGPDGLVWHSGIPPNPSGLTAEGACAVGLRVPETFMNAVVDRPVTLRARLYVTLFGPDQLGTVPVGQPAVEVPGAGMCAGQRIYRSVRVECRTAFRTPGPVSQWWRPPVC
jgi:hypothetical protein